MKKLIVKYSTEYLFNQIITISLMLLIVIIDFVTYKEIMITYIFELLIAIIISCYYRRKYGYKLKKVELKFKRRILIQIISLIVIGIVLINYLNIKDKIHLIIILFIFSNFIFNILLFFDIVEKKNHLRNLLKRQNEE